jgi:hypothetical protein
MGKLEGEVITKVALSSIPAKSSIDVNRGCPKGISSF